MEFNHFGRFNINIGTNIDKDLQNEQKVKEWVEAVRKREIFKKF